MSDYDKKLICCHTCKISRSCKRSQEDECFVSCYLGYKHHKYPNFKKKYNFKYINWVYEGDDIDSAFNYVLTDKDFEI
jgi:hypothetical protein